jgi:phosphatidylglycerophosphate synthase
MAPKSGNQSASPKSSPAAVSVEGKTPKPSGAKANAAEAKPANDGKSGGTYTYTPPKPGWLFRNVLGPMYDKLVNYLPTSWTPNGMTVFGIGCTSIASLLYFSQVPATRDLRTPHFGFLVSLSSLFPSASAWSSAATSVKGVDAGLFFPHMNSALLVGVGILNFVYCFADNLDGRQARRLKKSSPIGEYLDHGLDCVTSLLSTVVLVGCGGLSLQCAAMAMAMVAYQTTLSHVCNLRRNVFIYGTEFGSVDEAMTAFGLVPIMAGLWPAFQDATLAVIGLPWLRVVDVAFGSFVFGQFAFVAEISKVYSSCWRHPTCLFQTALLLCFGAMANIHHGGTDPRILHQFQHDGLAALPVFSSYPVMWFITMGCCASMVVHDAIITKCVAKTAGQDAATAPQGIVPYIASVAAAATFYFCPHGGATIATTVHVGLVLFNISRILKAAKSHK